MSAIDYGPLGGVGQARSTPLWGVSNSRPELPELGTLGANVRRERVARGIMQEQLAEMIEVNPRTIQKIEAGKLNMTRPAVRKANS
ncbi:MAG TPA: helix-turn-helix transcriptional regulator [Verrucomicrobiota bacterium]|nr:helix-turn-helix transcriptional regulator [Verrucomicrobiota bacterium]